MRRRRHDPIADAERKADLARLKILQQAGRGHPAPRLSPLDLLVANPDSQNQTRLSDIGANPGDNSDTMTNVDKTLNEAKQSPAIYHTRFDPVGGGGVFVSGVTGKEYRFTAEPDGRSKRNAFADLLADDRAAVDALKSRLGGKREPTLREIHEGIPDTKSVMQVFSQPEANPDANPYTQAIDGMGHLPADPRERSLHNMLVKRLGELEKEWPKKRAAEREREERMADPKVGDAIADATAWHGRLIHRPDVPQEWVERAKRRLAIAERGDHEMYWTETLAFEEEWKAHFHKEAATLADQAADMKALAAEVKRESKLPSEPAPVA